jgi:hypothetical protein
MEMPAHPSGIRSGATFLDAALAAQASSPPGSISLRAASVRLPDREG